MGEIGKWLKLYESDNLSVKVRAARGLLENTERLDLLADSLQEALENLIAYECDMFEKLPW